MSLVQVSIHPAQLLTLVPLVSVIFPWFGVCVSTTVMTATLKLVPSYTNINTVMSGFSSRLIIHTVLCNKKTKKQKTKNKKQKKNQNQNLASF
jgi:hypothetical protein